MVETDEDNEFLSGHPLKKTEIKNHDIYQKNFPKRSQLRDE